jgi:hypothetical protein
MQNGELDRLMRLVRLFLFAGGASDTWAGELAAEAASKHGRLDKLAQFD